MIDIHTHILPGVDDGVEDEDAAVEFARVAWDDGVRVTVATPHCRDGFYVNERDEVLENVRKLRERLSREALELDVRPGAEVHFCPGLVERVRDGRAPTLDDNGRTLLLELSLSQYPVEVDNVIFELKLAGLEVLLAHPERIRYFRDDVKRYEALVEQGAYGQITTGSVLGVFGSEIREFSEELLRKGLVHVLASDAHNVRGRPPRLSEARAACVPLVGAAFAQSMVLDTPRALLAGSAPEIPALDGDVRRRGTFLSRWFGKRQGG